LFEKTFGIFLGKEFPFINVSEKITFCTKIKKNIIKNGILEKSKKMDNGGMTKLNHNTKFVFELGKEIGSMEAGFPDYFARGIGMGFTIECKFDFGKAAGTEISTEFVGTNGGRNGKHDGR
jgi:hypothetical protein